MTVPRSKPAFAAGCVLLIAILFVARPGVGRLRARIVQSIGSALGRTVEASSVKLRFLPHPGFELENFVVHDVPAFGAEPILRSGAVTAELRLTSLLRGRLEISRLSLTDPSLNLVRNSEGHWNVENLLERTAQNYVAPTGAKIQQRVEFPYIEADSARINCKLGQEKTAYALTDATFALWQDSENSWGMRLKARPVRTDSNLSDIGLLRVNGSWQRAPRLRNTPLQFSLQWDGAQLGQASKLFYGSDKGWRGDVTLSVHVAGTPADLTISSRASIDDFHRYDISAGSSLKLAGQCAARYSSGTHALSQIVCSAPVGRGAISLNGEAGGPAGLSNYDLVLTTHDIPMQALVTAAIHAKKDLPEDLTATGNLEARVRLRGASSGEGQGKLWEGSGQTRGFRVQSKLANTDLDLGTVGFAITPKELGAPPDVSTKRNLSARKIFQHEISSLAPEQCFDPCLTIQPFVVDLGSSAPATAQGLISRTGYSFSLRGDAKLQTLLHLKRVFAIPGPGFLVEGPAKVDLQVAGAWHEFSPPKVFGSAQLRSVRTEVRGLNAPLEIATADVVLAEEGIRFQNVSASLADTEWRGWVLAPRSCGAPQPCPVTFDLHTADLSIDRLKELAGAAPNPKNSVPKKWYRVFASSVQQGSSLPLNLQAVGKLSVDRLTLGKYTAKGVSAEAAFLHGVLTLSGVKSEFLHGRAEAEWQVDFAAKPPKQSGKGVLRSISLEQLPAGADSGWILGTATAIFRVPGTGSNETDASSTASLVVDVRDGLLPHLTLPSNAGPLHIQHFTGRLVFHGSKFEIQDGKLQTPGIFYQVRGSAWPGHMLNLNLAPVVGRGFTIRGTLTEPRVLSDAAVETEARLKP